MSNHKPAGKQVIKEVIDFLAPRPHMRGQRSAKQRELAANPPRLRFGLFSRASLFTRVVQHPLLAQPFRPRDAA